MDTNIHFSFQFMTSKVGADWLRSILDRAKNSKDLGNDYPEDLEFRSAFPTWSETGYGIGFSYHMEPVDPVPGPDDEIKNLIMCIYDSDGYGDVDSVVFFVREYLSRFDPYGAIGFDYALTSSHHRMNGGIGEFGGGACIVTAKEVKWLSTTDWIVNEVDKMSRQMHPMTLRNPNVDSSGKVNEDS